jgi:hypothetical protein
MSLYPEARLSPRAGRKTMTSPEPEYNLTSDRYDALIEALELLYIRGNMSGRQQFLKEWPEVGERIFGPTLIDFDTHGGFTREAREAEEIAAEDRRVAFLDMAEKLEERSADKGVLQVEYVNGLIKDLGRDLALILYAPRIVDRIIPPPAAPAYTEAQPQQKKSVAPAEEEMKMPEDPLGHIKPIST